MAGNLIQMTVPIPRSRQEAHDVLHEHMSGMQVILTHLQECDSGATGEIATAALTATSALLSLHIYLSSVLEFLSARLPPRDRMGGGFRLGEDMAAHCFECEELVSSDPIYNDESLLVRCSCCECPLCEDCALILGGMCKPCRKVVDAP